jgi:hypothetical protein
VGRHQGVVAASGLARALSPVRFARGGQRIALPGAYGLRLANAPKRLSGMADGLLVVSPVAFRTLRDVVLMSYLELAGRHRYQCAGVIGSQTVKAPLADKCHERLAGFDVLRGRWAKERTSGCMVRWHRLVRDDEQRTEVAEVMIDLAMGSRWPRSVVHP